MSYKKTRCRHAHLCALHYLPFFSFYIRHIKKKKREMNEKMRFNVWTVKRLTVVWLQSTTPKKNESVISEDRGAGRSRGRCPAHSLSTARTPAVRKSGSRLEAADIVAIRGGSIREGAALQLECEGFSRHTVIHFSSASGCEAAAAAGGGGGVVGAAGLQLKASNNNRGLSQTKATHRGGWLKKQHVNSKQGLGSDRVGN